MRKSVDFDLEYRVDGQTSIQTFRIDFISNWCIREYNVILTYIFDVKKKWDKLNLILEEINLLKSTKENGWREKVKEFDSESRKIYSELAQYGDKHVETERFGLIRQILIDNGYKDERFLNFDFWDRCVSPGDTNLFLESCIWKDIDKKKH